MPYQENRASDSPARLKKRTRLFKIFAWGCPVGCLGVLVFVVVVGLIGSAMTGDGEVGLVKERPDPEEPDSSHKSPQNRDTRKTEGTANQMIDGPYIAVITSMANLDDGYIEAYTPSVEGQEEQPPLTSSNHIRLKAGTRVDRLGREIRLRTPRVPFRARSSFTYELVRVLDGIHQGKKCYVNFYHLEKPSPSSIIDKQVDRLSQLPPR